MTQDEIKQQVATLLTMKCYSYIEIARRLGLTESRVGAIITDLRRIGILPPTTHRNQRIISRLTQPVDSVKFQEAIQAVELAIDRYAAVIEDSPSNVLCFLSARETMELGAQLIC
ncbi:MAG: hypothetical protein ACYCYO_22575 [Bacilli bacterium]